MSDYVAGKKMRSGAIDPCLGYYMHSRKKRARGHPENMLSGQLGTTWDTLCVPTFFDAEKELELPVNLFSPSDLEVSMESEELAGQTADFCKETLALISATGAAGHQQIVNHSSIRLAKCAEAVTVESFLNHSTKLRTSRARKRPTKELDALPNDDQEDALVRRRPRPVPRILSDDDSDFGKESQQSLSAKHPKMRRRRKRKPWKDRLYEAAIATYCVPDDCFIQNLQGDGDPADQTRAPLHFVPCSPESPRAVNLTSHSSSRLSSTKRKIDSQRTRTIMHTSTFSDRHLRFTDAGVLVNSLDRLPLSKWRLDLDNRNQIGVNEAQSKITKSYNKKITRATNMATRDVAYPPLTFISLNEAEIKYKTMFAGHGARNPSDQTPDESGLKLIQVNEAVSSATHTFAASPVHLSDPSEDQPRCHEEGLSPIVCLPQSPVVPTASDLAGPSSSAAGKLSLGKDPLRETGAITVLISLEGKIRLNEVSEPPLSPEHRVLARNEQLQKDQQAKYRHLKPLGYLTDDFLSNIRIVSRPQDSGQPNFLPHK